MAQRTVTVLTDDVDGGQAPAAESVRFALDGMAYVIDLNETNAARLREDFFSWVYRAREQAGFRTRRAASGRRAAAARSASTAVVRAWARQAGHQVSDRGRIKAEMRQAYEDAHL